jgi:hypothetical protein
MESGRGQATLGKDQCLRLLDSVPFGRIIFTARAMPNVALVPHVRVGDQIIVPASMGIGVAAGGGKGTVVAYEADLLGPDQRPSWTVLVLGRALRMAIRDLSADQRERLSSWPDGVPDEVIMIAADLVTGEQILRGRPGPGPGPAPRAIQPRDRARLAM